MCSCRCLLVQQAGLPFHGQAPAGSFYHVAPKSSQHRRSWLWQVCSAERSAVPAIVYKQLGLTICATFFAGLFCCVNIRMPFSMMYFYF